MINNDILTFNGGRLGNQLYYMLQSYIRNSKYYTRICNLSYDNDINQVKQTLIQLNCGQFLSNEPYTKYINSYCQQININFTTEQLQSFIQNIILKSEYFNTKLNEFGINEKDLCLYIRCGDYLNIPCHNCFDRIQYLNMAFDILGEQFERVIVVSDDLEYCRNNYFDSIKSRINDVVFHEKQSVLNDFIYLCLFKNKIIWNSTFSIWSAFISNVLFENSYSNIICPSVFIDNNESRYIDNHDTCYDGRWKFINVK